MEYTWTGDVKLFVPGVGTVPPHSIFEMENESLKMSGVKYLLKTGEIKKGNVLVVDDPETDIPPVIVDPDKIPETDPPELE